MHYPKVRLLGQSSRSARKADHWQKFEFVRRSLDNLTLKHQWRCRCGHEWPPWCVSCDRCYTLAGGSPDDDDIEVCGEPVFGLNVSYGKSITRQPLLSGVNAVYAEARHGRYVGRHCIKIADWVPTDPWLRLEFGVGARVHALLVARGFPDSDVREGVDLLIALSERWLLRNEPETLDRLIADANRLR